MILYANFFSESTHEVQIFLFGERIASEFKFSCPKSVENLEELKILSPNLMHFDSWVHAVEIFDSEGFEKVIFKKISKIDGK